MKRLKMKTIEKELYYQGEIIVRYVIEFPEVIEDEYQDKKFNYYTRKEVLKLKNFAEGEFYQFAKESYEFNKKNKYPTIVYELYRQCN